MITIKNDIIKKQNNFWNNCIFHPTDAVEDAWGKRILDRMADDKAIHTVRIYTMFEDIVLMDENGKLTYDFRLNDLRLDYLIEKGYNILLAYAMMPECIATNKNATSCVSKNKTRYKGKLINTSAPTDYALWEEICYEYTKHIVERYGIDTVSEWYLHCYNEPDVDAFFLSDIPYENYKPRMEEYCKLYRAFESGILKVSDKLHFGGPALAGRLDFFDGFLDYVKKNNLRLDFISLHNYGGMSSQTLNAGEKFEVQKWIDIQQKYADLLEKHGFGDKEIVIDEWGMATQGFFNIEECLPFIARENEVFSSYYVKLIHQIIENNFNISKLMICLSGQHEMTTDFSGFRNFFTLNFFAKPIYNAHVLASKLHENLLTAESECDNLFVIPTKDDNGNFAALLTYSSDYFEEDIPEKEEQITFDTDISGKKITVYLIDKNTTNPYSLYQKKGITEPSFEDIKELHEEGNIKPVAQYDALEPVTLRLTANSVYLVTVE